MTSATRTPQLCWRTSLPWQVTWRPVLTSWRTLTQLDTNKASCCPPQGNSSAFTYCHCSWPYACMFVDGCVLGGFLHWSQTATETSASLSVEISSYVMLAKLKCLAQCWRPGLHLWHCQMADGSAELLWRLLVHTGTSQTEEWFIA